MSKLKTSIERISFRFYFKPFGCPPTQKSWALMAASLPQYKYERRRFLELRRFLKAFSG
jgi:hypothetical protein